MADVTSGENLTVIVLDEAEADALGNLLDEFGMIPADKVEDRWAVDESYKILRDLAFAMVSG